MNYRKNMNDYSCYDRNMSRNSYGYQNENYDNDWANEEDNYGWNYYPDMSNFSHNEEDKEERFDKEDRKDDKRDCDNNSKTQCFERNSHRPCFRPCFPCFPKFPCFNNGCNKNFDCRNNCRKEFDCNYQRPNCNKDWDRRPNHDCDKKEHDHNDNTRLYFSGCIEFRNNNKKW